MSLDALLARLEHADLDGLREQWRRRYRAQRRSRFKTLLHNVLAWRIQADLYGGLDQETRELLRDEWPPREPAVPPGTTITREWRGVMHHIEATGDGFLYDGRRLKSLSEIERPFPRP